MTARRCPVCGNTDSTCGPSHPGHDGIVVDVASQEATMALKNYDVTLPSGYRTTLRLSEEDARKRGLEGKQKPAPRNKARSSKNKADRE